MRFSNAAGLQPRGDNEYRPTTSSGEPIAGRAGEDAMGSIRQGYLEGSNVKLVDEMVNLMVAQRAYEASARYFTTIVDTTPSASFSGIGSPRSTLWITRRASTAWMFTPTR